MPNANGNWERFSRGECPICAGTRKDKDCRRSPSGLVHCRSGNEAPAGWRFIGEDSLGFGLYAEGEGEQSGPVHFHQNHQKPVKKVRSPSTGPSTGVMGVEERDREFRRLLSRLPVELNLVDADDIHRRGISHEQYTRWKIHSLERYQNLGISFPANLPGIGKSGKSLANFHTGYIVPTCDPSGKITSLGQIRNRDRSEGQPRYPWLTGKNQHNQNGFSADLPNGEWPLQVAYPKVWDMEKSGQIGLCEGIGVKPHIAADRLGIPVVGAAGGIFSKSPNTLAEYISGIQNQWIARAEKRCHVELILLPDAGSVANKNVLGHYLQLQGLLWRGGFPLQVLWWGQSLKSTGDVDEVDHVDSSRIISWGKFRRLWQTPISVLGRIKEELDGVSDRVSRQLGYRTPKPVIKYPKAKPKLIEPIVEPVKVECVAIVPWTEPRRWVIDLSTEEIPEIEKWKAWGSPLIIYPPENHNQVQADLLRKGYQKILLCGAGGQGKTHLAGQFCQDWGSIRASIPGFEDAKIHFTAPDYRNPSTATVEQIEEKVSPAALDEDPTKLTPLGNPSRTRHIGSGEADIEPLCKHDRTVQSIQQIIGGVMERSYDSPLCKEACGESATCPFLQAKAAQADSVALRSDIKSVSLSDEPDVLVVDELGQHLDIVQNLYSSVSEISREIGNFAQDYPQLWQRFQPVFEAISNPIRRIALEIDDKGLSKSQLLEYLPSREQLEAIYWDCVASEFINCEDVWSLSIDNLFKKLHQSNNPNRWRDWVESARKEGRRISPKALADWMSSQPVYRLWQVINNKLSVRLESCKVEDKPSVTIVFSRRNPKIQSALKQAGAVIGLDATPDKWEFSRKVGCSPKDIVMAMPLRPNYSNMKFHRITEIGALNNSRTQLSDKRSSQYELQNRAIKLVEFIHNQKHGKTAVFDSKKFIHHYQNIDSEIVTGYNFHDNRRSNAFMDCSQYISMGESIPNLGAMLTQYELLTGQQYSVADAPETFWAWVKRKQVAEDVQFAYRARSQHRQGDIDCWIGHSLSDSQWERLQRYFPGASFKEHRAIDLCAEAAPKGVQTERAIVEEMWRLTMERESFTTTDVSRGVGCDRTRVSQVVNSLHSQGFGGLSRVLEMLLMSLNSKINSDIPDELLEIADQFLPQIAKLLREGEVSAEDAVDFVVEMAVAHTEQEFEAVLAATPPEAIATLFTEFLPLAGDAAMEWLIRDFRERLEVRGISQQILTKS